MALQDPEIADFSSKRGRRVTPPSALWAGAGSQWMAPPKRLAPRQLKSNIFAHSLNFTVGHRNAARALGGKSLCFQEAGAVKGVQS